MRTNQEGVNRMLTSGYPNISFDLSYANYLTYLKFSDKHQGETASLATLLPTWLGTPATLRALDVGAGNGRLARTVQTLYGSIGGEFSLTLLEPAARASASLREDFSDDSRVTVLEKSLQKMLVGNNQRFDLILASHVSYYFEDRDALFNTLCDLLSPGGLLCLISGSISLLDHSIYKQLMPQVLDFGAGKRTFESDGYGSCAEELQLIGFCNGRVLSTTKVPTSMTFTREQILDAAEALRTRDGCNSNDLCRTLGFLWRTSLDTIFEKRELILDFLHKELSDHSSIVIPCEDHIMMLKAPG